MKSYKERFVMGAILAIVLIPIMMISEKCNAQAKVFPKVNGDYGYEEIISLDSSFKKDDLYRNSKLYFVDNFKSANDVIQYDDKEQGKLIGKGFFNVYEIQDAFLTTIGMSWDIYYSTEIISKDGRYRYRIYDIYIKETIGTSGPYKKTIEAAYSETQKGYYKKLNVKLINKMIDRFNANTETIKSYMGKKQAGNSKDDF